VLRSPEQLADLVDEHKYEGDIVVHMDEGAFLIATDDERVTDARFFPLDTAYITCREGPRRGFVYWLPLKLRDGRLVACESDGSDMHPSLDLPPLPPKVMVQMYRALKEHNHAPAD